MEIQVWSDVICPWCYIGKRRLERAIRSEGSSEGVEIRYRSYELDPNAPRGAIERLTERLARRYGWTPAQVDATNARVTEVAASEGLEYRLDRAVPSNTLDAHRLLQLAGSRGRRPQVEERFFRAYFTEGVPIGDTRELIRLATEAGVPEDEAIRVLAGAEFTTEVRADEEEARSIGARGVPFFVFDRRFGVSGAQPLEVFQDALRRSRAPAESTAPSAE